MSAVLIIPLAALGGVALGLVHFAALEMQVRALVEKQGVVRIVLPMARFAITAAGLYLAVRMGAAPLAAATLGFLIARAAMLRWKARPA